MFCRKVDVLVVGELTGDGAILTLFQRRRESSGGEEGSECGGGELHFDD